MMLRILLFVLLLIPSSWTEIGRKNTAIKAAARSYAEADYAASVNNHLLLSSDFGVNSPASIFNLALSYHYNEQVEEAQRTYQSLLSASDAFVASFASNQNGIILAQQNKYEEALASFKFSLIKDPTNEQARYNYELLSRWLEENPEQQQQDQGENEEQQDEQQEQQDQDQQKDSQEKKDGEGDEETEEDEASESQKKEDKSGEKSQQEKESEEASDLESDLSDREKAMEKLKDKLQEMNLTPEQAAQILEAMNAAELRYIQQNTKKPSKRPDKGLPDW